MRIACGHRRRRDDPLQFNCRLISSHAPGVLLRSGASRSSRDLAQISKRFPLVATCSRPSRQKPVVSMEVHSVRRPALAAGLREAAILAAALALSEEKMARQFVTEPSDAGVSVCACVGRPVHDLLPPSWPAIAAFPRHLRSHSISQWIPSAATAGFHISPNLGHLANASLPPSVRVRTAFPSSSTPFRIFINS